MALKSIGYKMGIAAASPNELAHAVEQLKEEHAFLRNKINHLEMNAKKIKSLEDAQELLQLVLKLKEQIAAFSADLQRHSDWEDQSLFSFLRSYFNLEPVPTITPSFWVLEKDHELADSFLRSFTEAVKKMTPATVEKKRLVDAASYLLQACLILNDHLTMEEQLVLPLSEQVLTDLEYFFS